MSANNISLVRVFSTIVGTRLLHIANWFGSFGARVLVAISFVFLLGYWLWLTIWQPLTAPRPLPVEVPEINPAVDTATLRQISEQRQQRLEHQSTPLFINGIITGSVPL